MRIVMMGTGTFAEPTFSALIEAGLNVVGLVTQPDRDAGRKGGATRQTGVGMAALAAAANIPVRRPEKVNAPDGLADLAAFAPDLLVVAAYGQILSTAVLATPTRGSINVHASLLPKYRGAAPVAHAILGGETVTGVTILRIIPGLDAGDIFAQESLAIGPDETAGELEARLAPLGARLCVDVARRLAAGPVLGTPQDPALVTKAPKFAKELGLIDWAWDAVPVVRHVRAMQPWPGAYTFLHRAGRPSVRLTITRANLDPTGDTDEPGSVQGVGPGGFAVAAGGGAVFVREVVPAGGKRMPAAEFARGQRLQAGAATFGPEPGAGASA